MEHITSTCKGCGLWSIFPIQEGAVVCVYTCVGDPQHRQGQVVCIHTREAIPNPLSFVLYACAADSHPVYVSALPA